MGEQPLAGRSIVITRPAGQADSLCAALAALGAEPLRFPLLTISPVSDTAPLEAVARRLDEFVGGLVVGAESRPNERRHS